MVSIAASTLAIDGDVVATPVVPSATNWRRRAPCAVAARPGKTATVVVCWLTVACISIAFLEEWIASYLSWRFDLPIPRWACFLCGKD